MGGKTRYRFFQTTITFLLFVSILIITTACQAKHITGQAPRDSFIFIQKKLLVHQCGHKQCREEVYRSSASGFIIKTTDYGAYGITAAHVCKRKLPITDPPLKSSANYKITTVEGKTFKAKVLSYDMSTDICMIFVPKMTDKDTAVIKIAKKAPEPGDRIYNIAAPAGIFVPGMVPIFEGRFNGVAERLAFYSMPAMPGSSGSVLLNEKGEAVGVLHSVYIRFPEIVLSCTYEELRDFVNYNLNKYEKYYEVMEDLELDNIFTII